MTKRGDIEEHIHQNTMYEPRKAQFLAEVTLEKEQEDVTEEVITIFANCKNACCRRSRIDPGPIL